MVQDCYMIVKIWVVLRMWLCCACHWLLGQRYYHLKACIPVIVFGLFSEDELELNTTSTIPVVLNVTFMPCCAKRWHSFAIPCRQCISRESLLGRYIADQAHWFILLIKLLDIKVWLKNSVCQHYCEQNFRGCEMMQAHSNYANFHL